MKLEDIIGMYAEKTAAGFHEAPQAKCGVVVLAALPADSEQDEIYRMTCAPFGFASPQELFEMSLALGAAAFALMAHPDAKPVTFEEWTAALERLRESGDYQMRFLGMEASTDGEDQQIDPKAD